MKSFTILWGGGGGSSRKSVEEMVEDLPHSTSYPGSYLRPPPPRRGGERR